MDQVSNLNLSSDSSDSESTSNPNSSRRPRKKSVSHSERAGILFPVGRIHRYLKEANKNDRVSKGGAVYLAAVLEYLAAEVIEVSVMHCRTTTRQRLTPRNIQMAVRVDDELRTVFENVIIPAGGVMPNINPSLITRQNKKKKRMEDSTEHRRPRSDHNDTYEVFQPSQEY